MKRVLIADDSVTARTFTRRCLEIVGFRDAEILEAGDGLQALVMLREQAVDLLVTDLIMPRLDGAELIRRVKQDAGLRHIPILVITSAGNPAKEQELLTAGAAAVVNKPVTPPKLFPVLNVLGFGEEGVP